jgi:flagellar export protein FliJ
MKPSFQLQAVLTVRERQEHVALEKYGRTLAGLRQANEHWRASQAECAVACAGRRALLARGGSAAELHQSNRYSQSLEERRQAAAAKLQTAQAGTEAARQEMLYRRRRREVVEKYLDNQRRIHALNASRTEQKWLDELGQLRRASLSSAIRQKGTL